MAKRKQYSAEFKAKVALADRCEDDQFKVGIGQGRRNIHSTVATMPASLASHLMGA